MQPHEVAPGVVMQDQGIRIQRQVGAQREILIREGAIASLDREDVGARDEQLVARRQHESLRHAGFVRVESNLVVVEEATRAAGVLAHDFAAVEVGHETIVVIQRERQCRGARRLVGADHETAPEVERDGRVLHGGREIRRDTGVGKAESAGCLGPGLVIKFRLVPHPP